MASVQEAADAKFNFYVYESYREFISEKYRNRSRVKFITDYDEKDLKRTLDPNFQGTVLRTLIEVFYYNQKYFNKHNFKIMKRQSPYIAIPTVFYFPKNYFLIEAIDEKIKALQSSGLIDYWTYNEHFDKNLLNQKHDHQGPKQLTMQHLMIAFQILLLGYFFAIAVLIAEHFLHKRKIMKINSTQQK